MKLELAASGLTEEEIGRRYLFTSAELQTSAVVKRVLSAASSGRLDRKRASPAQQVEALRMLQAAPESDEDAADAPTRRRASFPRCRPDFAANSSHSQRRPQSCTELR